MESGNSVFWEVYSGSGEVSSSVITSPVVTPAIEYIQETRPFLDTAFSDYSVVEGILLLILLSIWFYAVLSLIRAGFKRIFRR